jgi:competence protein ComEA
LLGVVITLLGVQAWNSLRWGSRPSDLERGVVLTYRVNLNSATRAELLQLPGIGPALAERIEGRRPFGRVNDLIDVPGIGPMTYERLRPWVAVSTEEEEPAAQPATVRKSKSSSGGTKKPALGELIDINRATVEQLQKLPNIGQKRAQAIVEERGKRPFVSVDELRRVKGIGPKILDQLRPLVTVVNDTATVAVAE